VRPSVGGAPTPSFCHRGLCPMGRFLTACISGLLLPVALGANVAAAQTKPVPSQIIAKALPTPNGSSASDAKPAEMLLAPAVRVQTVVEDVKSRLSIPQDVVVSVVAQDKLLVSVERMESREGAFTLAFERDFLDVLTDDELTAVVAHELGHVWIFTHHPYLQTEELANTVALRLVSRETLNSVYQKVWQRTGKPGELAYLPSK